MKIAILGWTDQGKSAYAYYRKQDTGHIITIRDSRIDIVVPDGVLSELGESYLNSLEDFDIIVRGAPTIHPRDIVAANSANILKKVTSNTNEFMQVCPTHNIIGVTGTKGKGTTSSLITRMLQAAGKTVHLGGNIGIPPLDLLQNHIQADDWVVLELANFQLIDLKYSPTIGVCLMVAPEHLNWHADMAEYVTAKQQLFVWQTYDDIAIYYHGNEYSTTIAGAGNGAKVPYFAAPGAVIVNDAITIQGQVICQTSELKLLGKHNWQNACAAVTAAWQITHSAAAVRSVLTSFSGLEHRLEFVREIGGVSYYDDSFGTTPETAIVALEAFEQPKVVILGGSDKGADYSQLAEAVRVNNVRRALLIGDQAGRIQAGLQGVSFTNFVDGGTTMTDIVANAQSAAEAGDVVLLSTGCASFGMFHDYKDRGQQFQAAVEKLA